MITKFKGELIINNVFLKTIALFELSTFQTAFGRETMNAFKEEKKVKMHSICIRNYAYVLKYVNKCA